MLNYPKAKNPYQVGTYPAIVKSGGGYVWDDILEYRVWCHPYNGAPDLLNGDDYYYAFVTYKEAFDYYRSHLGCEEPLALILQKEFIEEPEPGIYLHRKEERLTEWPVQFLYRPRRTENMIRDFLSPDASPNRLDILRGFHK